MHIHTDLKLRRHEFASWFDLLLLHHLAPDFHVNNSGQRLDKVLGFFVCLFYFGLVWFHVVVIVVVLLFALISLPCAQL